MCAFVLMNVLRRLSPLFIVSFFPLVIQAAIYKEVEDLPSKSFDFIVIGGGTAGCVIANRLTENPAYNVLVIEAGPSNEGVLNSMVPAFTFNLVLSEFDWNYTTTPQTALNGRTLIYPRGHILGGSSSTNGMTYTRGSSDDYDRFATVTEDPGWSWNRIQPYIRRNERWTLPADHHNTIGEFNPIFHSLTGINYVSLPGFNTSRHTRYLQTAHDLPQEFPFNLDMNSGYPIGVGWLQSTIGNGERSSSATSYLGPRFINRPNLHVLLETRVTRVLKVNDNARKPSFRIVEATKSADGPKTQITAHKEVIVSGGSIGTPQVLLNSGIGDRDELSALGITPVLHLPSVGKNLTDHPSAFLSWSTTQGDIPSITMNATLLAAALEQWNTTRTGPLVVFLGPQRGYIRIPDNAPIFQNFPNPAAGPNTPHIELELADNIGIDTGASTGVAFLTPTSRGSITLQSNNPFDAPLVNPAYLQTEFDMAGMREAIKSALRFFSGPAWNGFIISSQQLPANPTTEQLDEFIRSSVSGTGHISGTAAMSAKGATYGVVDPDLSLKGANGIRVVDASIMPFVIAGHTQAPVYIIAERAADLIKGDWR